MKTNKMVKGMFSALVLMGISTAVSAATFNNPKVNGVNGSGQYVQNALLFAGDSQLRNQYCIDKGYSLSTNHQSRMLISFMEYQMGNPNNIQPENVASHYRYGDYQIFNILAPFPVISSITCQ